MGTHLPSSIQHFDEMVSLFDYDPSAPLQVEEHGAERRNGIALRDVSYAGAGGGRVKAYCVLPAGEGPFPGVIFVHPAPGDRSIFLVEALLLGKMGIASLLVQAPWAQGEAFGQSLAEPENAREAISQVVKDLRRAVDFVASRPEMDAGRLGYVGHSIGAHIGGVLSGVERRIGSHVLMAGTGSFTHVAALNMPFLKGQALERYARVMEPIDPAYYVGRAAPSALFFQFGLGDDFSDREVFEQYAEAASQPRLVRWYDTDHYFENAAGRSDRLEWLQSRLGL
jgi:predicted alpha/beta hydrolase